VHCQGSSYKTRQTALDRASPIHSIMAERYPLPFGWAKELDQTSGHQFYVDTKANPPWSIWTHPYEDEEYLRAHPDVREKVGTGGFGGSESSLRPPSFEENKQGHSSGGSSPSNEPQVTGISTTNSSKRKDRGFLGKLKDKAIGTKEEREAEKKRKQEEDRVRKEAQQRYSQQTTMAPQRAYVSQHGHNPTVEHYPSNRDYGSHHQGYSSGSGGIGVGLPAIGGIVGGLMLVGALDGGGCGSF